MDTLHIQSLSLHIHPNLTQPSSLWAYCIVKGNDNSYCTPCKQIISKESVQILASDASFILNLTKSHFLFKIEVWDYDKCEKIGETHIFNSDLPKGKKSADHVITDASQKSIIHLRIQYERGKEHSLERNEGKIHQRSQSKIKVISKNTSGKKLSDGLNYCPDYGCSIFGKVKLPLRKQTNFGYKLKL